VNARPLPPSPPSPPLWSPFDADTYRSTLADVYHVAARVRNHWQRLQRVLLRADGALLLALSGLNLLQATQPNPIGYTMYDFQWFFWLAAAVCGAFLIAFTPQVQSWGIRRAVRKGRVPPLDLGATEPTLGASVLVFGRMQEEWNAVYLGLVATVGLFLVALANGAELLVRGLAAILGAAPAAVGALWLLAAVGVVAPGLLGLGFWGRDNWKHLRAREPVVRGIEARFGQLEWVFWQRY